MNTESARTPKIKRSRLGLIPLLLALPFAAVLIYAALRWGPTLRDLIYVAVKMVVIT